MLKCTAPVDYKSSIIEIQALSRKIPLPVAITFSVSVEVLTPVEIMIDPATLCSELPCVEENEGTRPMLSNTRPADSPLDTVRRSILTM